MSGDQMILGLAWLALLFPAGLSVLILVGVATVAFKPAQWAAMGTAWIAGFGAVSVLILVAFACLTRAVFF